MVLRMESCSTDEVFSDRSQLACKASEKLTEPAQPVRVRAPGVDSRWSRRTSDKMSTFADGAEMDIFSTEKRSDIMSKIHSGDTKPEMVVRRLLFAMGFRYRLHDRTLPGVPDLVLRKYRTVVFVHGCFWHAHEGCPRATVPQSNETFWREKLARNKARDEAVRNALLNAGWRVLTIWECACARKTLPLLAKNAAEFLRDRNRASFEIDGRLLRELLHQDSQ